MLSELPAVHFCILTSPFSQVVPGFHFNNKLKILHPNTNYQDGVRTWGQCQSQNFHIGQAKRLCRLVESGVEGWMICPEVYLYRKCTVVFNDASLWKDIVGALSSYLLIFGSATVHDIKIGRRPEVVSHSLVLCRTRL